jgi:hypothetical protein
VSAETIPRLEPLLISPAIVGNTAPWALMSIDFSLTNGGTAGSVIMFAIVAFFMFFVVLVSRPSEESCATTADDLIVYGGASQHGTNERRTVPYVC